MEIFAVVLFVIAAIFISQSIKVVPQQNAWIVERLGKYFVTLSPGLSFLVPFVDRVAYRHSLKEIPLDVPSQVCITRDNTQLQVDGIIYYQITDAMRASYGSSNYVVAITQLAQTTPMSNRHTSSDSCKRSRKCRCRKRSMASSNRAVASDSSGIRTTDPKSARSRAKRFCTPFGEKARKRSR